MASRGQKRTEMVDELPADKRACSSFEFRPSTSNSSAPTPISSSNEAHDADMETSSSTSGSTRSEVDGEKDSTYGSCDSDSSLRDYYRHRSTSDHNKFKKVLSSLNDEVDGSGQLALLTELCELLSFCSDGSLSSLMADSFSPILVRLARHESNPDIMLLSVRAITYLCDVNPRSSGFLVRHDAVPALCQRLIAFEYLDVAEQCLQALEKISREQPLACLQSGAIMTALSYIDFFSTSVQRIALSTVVNICKKVSSESHTFCMDAVPILCNLLQCEDRQLVEMAATCLIRIGEQVYHSPDTLDEFCKHGLVRHVLHLIGLNSHTTLSQSTNTGLIGLLVKLAAGSTVAFKKLFELDVSNTMKDMLSSYHISHGTQSTTLLDGHHNQIHEVLKLLNELLPSATAEQDDQLKLDKEAFLLSNADILPKLGVNLLPVLIQVVNSGANMFVCYGCLSIINKLIHFSTPEVLQRMLQSVNFSSFLAGIFARKDHHVILLALEIVDTLMLKLPHVFLNSFIKEGVLFAISALIPPDKDLKPSPAFDGMRLESGGVQKSPLRDVFRCPCFAFDASQSSKFPESGACKIQKDSVQKLAGHIWTAFFESESGNSDKGVTDILQKLRALAGSLTTLLDKPLKDVTSIQLEEELHAILHQILSELSVKDSISTFEFVESGIIKALVRYLSDDRHYVGKETNNTANQWYDKEKRFDMFGRLLLSCDSPVLEKFSLLTLIRRLQSALSSVENFPVVSSQSFKLRNSYATVPYGRCISYPCLKVQFLRDDGETYLCDYNEVVSVDPFVPLGTLEGYLLPRVCNMETKKASAGSKNSKGEDSSCSHLPSNSCKSSGQNTDAILSGESAGDAHNLKDGKPEDTASCEQNNVNLADVIGVHAVTVEKIENNHEHADGATSPDRQRCCNSEESSVALFFYLEGQQLNCELTLYQSILQQLIEVGNDNILSFGLWTRIYKITYRSVNAKPNLIKHNCNEAQYPALSKRTSFGHHSSFNSQMFRSEGDLEGLGPPYDILSLLKSLEKMNRLRFDVLSREKWYAFAKGRTDDLDKLNIAVNDVSQNEFVNSKLTEKLEQQMRDPVSVHVGGMPAWCSELMYGCPFLFGFEARCKYFQLAALGRLSFQIQSSHNNIGGFSGRQQIHNNFQRRKFLVHRNTILESAAQMMELHACQKFPLEVEYNEEVGTGLGPTLEFYTLVCHEFQRCGLGMWRDDHVDSEFLASPFGLFPRPWSPSSSTPCSDTFSEVIKKFYLLGQIVAKALQDGRVLDLPFSSAFYKLILDKELSVYDIKSFDPALGKALFEFHAIVERKRHLLSLSEENSPELDVCFRNIKIEDLYLDFTLPGYPDYDLVFRPEAEMVNLNNLEDYVNLVWDATTKSGISRQVEAFKSGFDQVFPINHLKVFSEEELERLLCGEHVIWNSEELLDHVKFDHGYTISSPPIANLLEIMQTFNHEQQRAFLQFVTGAPRLPTGGLASLNPKLTIVRKHCGQRIDAELPSVMTCANYLKLPPYSSKEVMKMKLLYAITEGQGSFHLS